MKLRTRMVMRVRKNIPKILIFFQKTLDKSGRFVYNKIVAYGCGSLAQLGERLPYKQRVTGSSPVTPTSDIRPGSSAG